MRSLNVESTRNRMAAITATLITIVFAVAFGSGAFAQGAPSPGDPRYGGELTVPINKSQILQTDAAFKELMLGNPEIADVLPLTDQSIYILGKELGSTSLSIYGPNKRLIAVVDLIVTFDIAALKRRLHDLLPDETVEVRPANGSVVLSGMVSNADQVSRAIEVAERYAPGKVSNLLKVRGVQQVMLEVRFAEMSRTAARDLGLKNLNVGIAQGSNIELTDLSVNTLFPGFFIPTQSFAAAELIGNFGDLTLSAVMEAMEERGVMKTLAEPTLTALSGETASFLAGGEFPVPISQNLSGGASSITVEFKQFGVSLAFTPTILDDDTISMVVAPEVSTLDDNASVTLAGGFRVPGLSTRRARTTVELADGQSFAIAGLLQSNFQDQVSGFPFLTNLPVLGALFRSTSFQRDETELVIIVTPRLVKPARPSELVTAVDDFVPPGDLDLFLGGTLERTGAAGFDGPIGHIIR